MISSSKARNSHSKNNGKRANLDSIVAKALITGANGFIGYHLAKLLNERGDRVTGMVRPTSNTSTLSSLEIELVHGDVSDVASLKRCFAGQDVIYHLAGLTKANHQDDFRQVNEAGAGNVAFAGKSAQSPPVIVNVSSLAAVGPAVAGQPKVETSPATPVSHYGRSKLSGEVTMRAFASDVPITIVRPPIVFGEADRAFLNIVRPISRIGLHTVPGYTDKLFSLIHAADLATLLVATFEQGERLADESEPIGQGIYFAEAEQRVTYGQLGLMIGTALEKRVRQLKLPHAAIWLAAGIAQWSTALTQRGRFPALNLDKAREATAGSWICSAEKAIAQFAFAPAQPLLERLRSTVDWYDSEGWI
jgi:nucleoside-diphosphate-sugar epimerase